VRLLDQLIKEIDAAENFWLLLKYMKTLESFI